MSAIFGLIDFAGDPVDAPFATLAAAMAHWGPDRVQVWHDGFVGLGQCLLHDTPEAQYEQLPWLAPDHSLCVTAEARLDNRDELCDRLDIPLPERRRVADGTIVRLAYEKWGHRCPERMLGDWSFAAWDRRERRLFLARDHFGQTALYYTWDGRRLGFASEKAALLALPFVSPTLNEYRLAQRLIVWVGDPSPETLHADINRVLPAHALTAKQGQIRTTQYWRLADAPVVRLRGSQEYADGLREHLDRAVRARLRSPAPVGIALSGGLDSTSVAVLAARDLAVRGQALHAFTSVPMHDATAYAGGRIVNEYPFAQAALRPFPNVRHVAVDAAKMGPLHGARRMLEIHKEPGVAAGNQFWILAIHEAAQSAGVRVLLTGQQGNATISWHGFPTVAGLLSASGPAQLSREVTDLARFHFVDPARHQVNRWLAQWTGRPPWHAYSAIHPEFAARMQLLPRLAEAGIDPHFLRNLATGRLARARSLRPEASITGARWAQTAAAYGLVCRDPTSDIPLMTFAHGIPERHWRGPLHRWLIRQAMAGLLLDQVRLNTAAGRQGGDLVLRLRAEGQDIEELLRQMSAAEKSRNYIDISRLRACWGRVAADGSGSPSLLNVDAMVLIRGLAQGAFLLTQP